MVFWVAFHNTWLRQTSENKMLKISFTRERNVATSYGSVSCYMSVLNFGPWMTIIYAPKIRIITGVGTALFLTTKYENHRTVFERTHFFSEDPFHFSESQSGRTSTEWQRPSVKQARTVKATLEQEQMAIVIRKENHYSLTKLLSKLHLLMSELSFEIEFERDWRTRIAFVSFEPRRTWLRRWQSIWARRGTKPKSRLTTESDCPLFCAVF